MCIHRLIEFDFLTVTSSDSLQSAIALMHQNQQNSLSDCVLVIAEKSLIGIVTKSDALKAVAKRWDIAVTTVDRVMSSPVWTIERSQCNNIQLVKDLMQQHSISYLPVIEANQTIVGVIEAKTLFSLSESDKLELNHKNAVNTSKNKYSTIELERFFNLSHSMLCIAGFDGYFKLVNSSFCETLGFSEAELFAQPFIDFIHSEDRAATITEVKNLKEGNTTVYFENRYRTKTGDYRWFLWTAKPYLAEEKIYAAARDITSRKKTELELIESEERWQLALRGANDGIWDWNVRTNEVFFSRRWKEMLGFAEEEISNNLEEWSKRVHPDDIERVTEVIKEHFARKTAFYISEHRVLCKDGTYKWILDRGQALWDDEGNVIRMAGSHTDITEQQTAFRKREEAEKKLARSENLLRTIFESEPECVKLLDREGKLLEMNPAGLAIIEAECLEQVKGKSVYPLIDPQYRTAYRELIEKVFAGRSGKLEFTLTSLKGTPRRLETNVVPLKDGDRIIASLAVTRDISDRKKTEAQLQQERDFSQAIINTVGALVAVLDRQGRVISFNHTCEQTTGYSFAEIQGQTVWDVLVIPEEQAIIKAVYERLLTGQVPNQYTNYWLAKDGLARLISWSNTALFDAKGAVEFIIATGIDITEQRRVWNKLERQYRQTNLIAEITRKIRMSIKIEEILQTAVTEVQHLINSDRVLIVEIRPNNTALPISEAVLPDLPSMLGYELVDPLLIGEHLARYRQGQILAIDNVANAAIAQEIKQLLKQFQIEAKLVIPILSQNELKGLLVAHQCHYARNWQDNEIRLLTQLADQIGVALSQAQLLDNLESMVAERTIELTTINQLLQNEITERKATEATLRENQQKLRGILDNADEAIISIDRQHKIQLFNQGAEKIFGYEATEIIGQPLDILLPKSFRHSHHQHVNRFANSKARSRTMAQRNDKVFGLRKNGEEFSAEASIAKLQTRTGLLFTVMLKDVTEQQQAREKVRSSQNLLAKAEKIAKIGSWEYNFVSKRTSWSDELFKILGFVNQGSIPPCKEIFERIHPDDLLLVKNTLKKGHQQGTPWNFNYRFVLPNGTIKHLETRGEPTIDSQGKVCKIWGTIVDVTQRIKTEKSLQRSEEQLKLITDGLPVLIAYIDSQQRYVYNNRTYETWFGKPRSALLGRKIAELYSQQDYQKMLPYIETTISGRAVSFEIQSTNKKGQTVWMYSTYVPDFDSNDRVKGFFSMIEDITERKQIEKMKSEFVSIASHEMRTPLTSVHGVIKLADAGLLGELSPKGKKMTNIALRNSDRLIRLINDILDLERLESGKDKIEKQLCNSHQIIQQAIETIGSLAKDHYIVEQNKDRSIQFLADGDRIVQTLTNLISNAIKFSPPNSKILVNCQQQENQIIFAVQDFGRGIPKDNLESIFDRFQQVDASDSRKRGGTGLGLAICRHIIAQHQGKIWAESVYGRGSTFFFTIPQ